jgi:hypothetical protein
MVYFLGGKPLVFFLLEKYDLDTYKGLFFVGLLGGGGEEGVK